MLPRFPSPADIALAFGVDEETARCAARNAIIILAKDFYASPGSVQPPTDPSWRPGQDAESIGASPRLRGHFIRLLASGAPPQWVLGQFGLAEAPVPPARAKPQKPDNSLSGRLLAFIARQPRSYQAICQSLGKSATLEPLTALLNSGDVVRISRGVYAHRDAADLQPNGRARRRRPRTGQASASPPPPQPPTSLSILQADAISDASSALVPAPAEAPAPPAPSPVAAPDITAAEPQASQVPPPGPGMSAEARSTEDATAVEPPEAHHIPRLNPAPNTGASTPSPRIPVGSLSTPHPTPLRAPFSPYAPAPHPASRSAPPHRRSPIAHKPYQGTGGPAEPSRDEIALGVKPDPLSVALIVLGDRVRRDRTLGFKLDGRVAGIKQLVIAANRILAERGERLIPYPGTSTSLIA